MTNKNKTYANTPVFANRGAKISFSLATALLCLLNALQAQTTISGFSNPQAFAYTGQSLLVVNQSTGSEQGPKQPGTISWLNPATKEIFRTTAVRKATYLAGIAIDGSHNIWVGGAVKAYPATGYAFEFSPSGKLLATVVCGVAPNALVYDNAGGIWIGDQNSASITKINASTASVALTIDTTSISGQFYKMAVDTSGHLWATFLNQSVAEYNIADGSLVAVFQFNFSSNEQNTAIAVLGSSIWACDQYGYLCFEFNSSGQTLATVYVGSDPQDLAYDGTNFWVPNYTGNSVSEIDPMTATVLDTIAVGTLPIAATVAAGNLWVANWTGTFTGTVSEISTSSDSRRLARALTPSRDSKHKLTPSDQWVTRVIAADGHVTLVKPALKRQ